MLRQSRYRARGREELTSQQDGVRKITHYGDFRREEATSAVSSNLKH